MKQFQYVIIALSINLFFSTIATAQGARYTFKKMDCVGAINQKPAGMHPDYTNFGLRVIQFKSKRQDGTFADSLGWNTFYGQTAAEVAQEMKQSKYGGEVWYTGLMNARMIGGKTFVYKRDSNTNFIGQILPDRDLATDILKARYKVSRSVVGNYFYNLKCRVIRKQM